MPRTETYVPDGTPRRADPRDVVAMWRRYTSRVPARYALGTAQHEANLAVNEVDTEVSGYVSKGIFQIADSEAVSVDHAGADLLDLEDATIVFTALCESRLDAIIAAAKLDANNLPPDVWAYLALAHNQGLGAARKTIARYGLDWAAYKQRNPDLAGIARYGDDVISGGDYWRPELDAPAAAVS